MAADGVARRIALALHRLVARSPLATWVYCRALVSLRSLLPDSVAGRLSNNLHGVTWPDVTLPAAAVRLGAATDVLLHPHLGEFDSEVLVRRVLTYEAALFRWLEPRVQSYDVIVEIGANVGVFTVFFSRLGRPAAPRPRVLAFEPSREAFRRLLENLTVNRADNVVAFNAAIGGTTGLADFHQPRGHLTNGSLVPAFAGLFAKEVTVEPVICLDGAAIAALVPPGANVLLKIDVEGAESTVLNTLSDFILQRKPDIVLEVLPGYEEQITTSIPVSTGRFSFHQLTAAGPIQRADLKGTGDDRDWWLRAEP